MRQKAQAGCYLQLPLNLVTLFRCAQLQLPLYLATLLRCAQLQLPLDLATYSMAVLRCSYLFLLATPPSL
jgi:hypothetical protein